MSQPWLDQTLSVSDCRATDLTIREMTEPDIGAGLRLCRLSGWNQLEPDWSLFLELSPRGCRVAEKHGTVVGTVATLRYQDRFSWLAMVLVDPAERGAGIGTTLLEEGLAILRGEECIKLDATPLGEPLYARHGFVEEFPLARMTAPRGHRPPLVDSRQVRPMRQEDLPGILFWDQNAFGADRGPLLLHFFTQASQYAWVAGENKILGYCFGRPGHKYDQIGPIVAKDENVAAALVSASIADRERPSVIDAPIAKAAWVARLNSFGFTQERPFVRMRCGVERRPELENTVFGIAGPEFG